MKTKFGKLEKIVGGVLLAGALAFNYGCGNSEEEIAEPVEPEPTYDEVIVSAEKPASYSGYGGIMSRGEAENARTWFMRGGSRADYNVALKPNSTYSCVSRYSNDGPRDDISIFLNGEEIINFNTQNTRSNEGSGDGWNNFTFSPTVSLTTGIETNNILSICANDTDSYGVEMDAVYFTRQE